MAVIQLISVAFIPVLISIILIYGIKKKKDVYELFIEGVKEGLKTALEILPFIMAIFIAIDILRESGAILFFQDVTKPLFDFLRVPPELFPLITMKPVSGSGALAIVEKVIEDYGVNSYIARSACAMLGSSETIFYTLAVYFGATHVKYGRHTLLAGMLSYGAGVAASLLFCNIF